MTKQIVFQATVFRALVALLILLGVVTESSRAQVHPRLSAELGQLTDGLMNPVSFGDYDGVSTDASGANPGFFSTLQVQVLGNPDIFGERF